MRLSTALLFALIAIVLTLEASGAATAKPRSLMEQQLMLVRNAQEQQQRSLLNVEFKLNRVISKLLSFTHIRPGDSLRELAGNLSKALDSWGQTQDRINQLQLSFQWKNELAQKMEEMHSMLALLVTKSQVPREWQRQNENGALETESEQMSEIKATKESNQASVEYLQPAKADCAELDDQQRVDGVYKFLEPELNEKQRDLNERYCAFATTGAAWTVIQRRTEQLENFNRSWDEYRSGFGSLESDFWFGNEFIHRLVYRDDYELRIELQDQLDVKVWAEYAIFRLDSESFNYQLVIGKMDDNSSTSDALSYHNGMDFRSSDWDGGCSGWWFDRCLEAQSNLNGQRIIWGNSRNEYLIKTSRMLIRPRSLNSLNTDEVYDEDSAYGF
ncbi:angiopoietin-related protein 7 [Drosophila mojavensis]|uniref:angiopoietin-related protein 7 n=1 Tax=Drosophila mojavensis TaxID=7230 RepID=UPI00017C83F9|nr:angiopoietin-related protein 7 [Drosophila mojavensis]